MAARKKRLKKFEHSLSAVWESNGSEDTPPPSLYLCTVHSTEECRLAHTYGTVLFWVMRPMSMPELGNKRRRRRKNFFLLAAVILSGIRQDTTAERKKKTHKAKVQYANWKDDFNWDFLKFELKAVLLTNSAAVEVLRGRLTDSYSVGKGPKRGNKWSLLFFPDLRRGNNNGQMTTSIFFFFFADARDLPPDIPRYRPTLQIPQKNSNYFL